MGRSIDRDFEIELETVADLLNRINRDDESHDDESQNEEIVWNLLSDTSSNKKSIKDFYLHFL